MFYISQKCKMVKVKVKEWSRNKSSNVIEQIRKTEEQMGQIQPHIIDNKTSINKKNLYCILLKFSTAYRQQKGKIKDMKLGDQNNTFFYRVASIKKKTEIC